MPAPLFTRPAEFVLLMTPANVTSWPFVSTWIADELPRIMPETSVETPAPYCSVPPVNDTVPVPARALPPPRASTPAPIVVEPV